MVQTALILDLRKISESSAQHLAEQITAIQATTTNADQKNPQLLDAEPGRLPPTRYAYSPWLVEPPDT